MKDTARTSLLNVGTVLVGFAPIKLPVTVKTYHGVRLTAGPNSCPVWIGNAPTVRSSGELCGYPLYPGQSIDLEIEHVGELYAISEDLSELSWASL